MTDQTAEAKWPHGRWHVTQTLAGNIGEGPDINPRHLRFGWDIIVTFNVHMGPWHPEGDKALHDLCLYLNSRKESRDAQ